MTQQPAALPPATTPDDFDLGRLVGVDPTTGEQLQPTDPGQGLAPAYLRDDTYEGLAELQLSDAQILALTEPVRDDEIEIKPDSFGAVYLSHAGYRRRLNKAFRQGGWGMRQISEWRYDDQAHVLTAEFAMKARGTDGKVCFISKAIGGQEYYGDKGSSRMTYDDAAQGAESNAITRCAKALGVALELWDRRAANIVRARLGILVWVRRDDKDKPAWRRWEDPPLAYEQGIHKDSPNADKYVRKGQASNTAAAPAAVSAPAPVANPAPAPPADVDWGKGGIITLKQAKRLYAIVQQSGISEADIAAHIKKHYNYTSSKQIAWKHYDAIVSWVQQGGDQPDEMGDRFGS